MAVKRVILQHFSMKYDYMTKERPNIYQPSRAKFRLGADDDDGDIPKMKDVNDDADEEENRTPRCSDLSSTGSGSEESMSPDLQPSDLMPPPKEPPSKPPMHNGGGGSLNRSDDANTTNWRSVEESPHHQHNRSLDTSTNSALLDSIIELKEKLPDNYKTTTVRKITDGGQEQQRPLVSRGSQYASNGNVGFYAPSNRSIVAPTVTLKGVPVENWRYRSSNSSAYRSGRQSGNNNYSDTVPYGGGGGGRRQRYNNGQGVGGGYNSYHSSTNNTSPQEIRNWRNECMNNSASRNCNMAAASAILGARRGPRGSLIEVDRRGSDASDVSCEYLGVGLSPPSESLLMQRRLRLNSRSSDIGPLGCNVPQVQTVSG